MKLLYLFVTKILTFVQNTSSTLRCIHNDYTMGTKRWRCLHRVRGGQEKHAHRAPPQVPAITHPVTAIKVGSSYQIFLKAVDEWNNTGTNHDSLVFKGSENAALTMNPALAQRWRYLWGWDKKDTSVSKSLTSQVSHFVRNHKADVCTELSYEFKNKQTNPPRSYRQHLLTLHK